MHKLRHILNFDKFPNILIGGTTGYGKTHFVRNELAALIEQKNPDDLQLAICISKVIDYDMLERASSYFLSLGNDFARYSPRKDICPLLQALIDECNRWIFRRC